MTSDKNDKTVFRQAPVNPDRTVVKPAPGRRGAARPSPNAAAPPLAQQPTQVQYNEQAQVTSHVQQNYSPAPSSMQFETSSGLNPLVNAASTLIAVFEKTRQSMSQANIGGLHQSLANEIKLFESKMKELRIQPEVILSARYCVCAALDEAVLNTPWGSESAWSQRTLLSIFHNESAGGEKFFTILERMLEYPAENLQILELLYIFLSLGFEGKYRVMSRGRDAIEQLRDEVFTSIRRQRGEYERTLSPSWQGLGNIRNSLASYVPFWVVTSILGVVLVLSYSGFRIWLYESSSPVIAKLDEIVDTRPASQ
ncbi:MAG: DotU family type IV/VI secretion system protein [Gammaproteobacteria bacterium]|nr:DotU family type IV/VI secretion system protein [Gammaproteobacteria bacterium]